MAQTAARGLARSCLEDGWVLLLHGVLFGRGHYERARLEVLQGHALHPWSGWAGLLGSHSCAGGFLGPAIRHLRSSAGWMGPRAKLGASGWHVAGIRSDTSSMAWVWLLCGGVGSIRGLLVPLVCLQVLAMVVAGGLRGLLLA